MFKTLSRQLLEHGRIFTTIAKAKRLREIVEPMITRAKSGTLHDRRLVAEWIPEAKVLKKLFTEVAELYKERKGGYTRILKAGPRKGDAAELVLIELVDYEKVYKKEEKPADKKAKGKTEAKKDEKKDEKKEDKKPAKKIEKKAEAEK